MTEKNLTEIFERITKVETKVEESYKHQSKKINEIHKALVGNGNPGLIAEFNQWKGGVRLFSWVIGIFLGILSLSVSVLAIIK